MSGQKQIKGTQRSPRKYWQGQGRRLVMIPSVAISNLLKKNKQLNPVYLTDMGYYPKAQGHLMQRSKGSPEHILFYCTNGRGWCQFQNKQYEVVANQFFLLPAQAAHAYGADSDNPWTIYWFMFKTTELESDLLKSLQHFHKPASLYSPQPLQENIEYIERILAQGYKSAGLTQANMHFGLMLMNILHRNRGLQPESAGNPVEKSILFMKEHLTERLTIQKIAATVGYSASRFHSIFKTETGYSPIEYHAQLRMKYACQLLLNSDQPIRDIAQSVGFEDPYHFSRVFKSVMGKSPLNYKSTMRV